MELAFPSPGKPRPNPSSSKDLRGAILLELKRADRATAKDLASQLGVSLNAVRHHLKELETAGLVEYQRRHRGVGAPAHAFRLTSKADLLFPRRYEATLNQVLDHIVERDGRAAAVSVLEARYDGLARKLDAEMAGMGPEDRLTAVAQFLADEGYMAEATTSASQASLVEHNCAIQEVAERFPEICAAEARFLSRVLGAEVNRTAHILSGCKACEYRIRFHPVPEAES